MGNSFVHYAIPKGSSEDFIAEAHLVARRVAVMGWPEDWVVSIVSSRVTTPEEAGKPEIAEIVDLLIEVEMLIRLPPQKLFEFKFNFEIGEVEDG